MIIDHKEYQTWINDQLDIRHDRFVSKKLNRKHPRLEKQRDFRKSRSPLSSGHFFNKENKWVKKAWSKKTRMMLKENLHNESYYNVYPKDYKTYGWMTW